MHHAHLLITKRMRVLKKRRKQHDWIVSNNAFKNATCRDTSKQLNICRVGSRSGLWNNGLSDEWIAEIIKGKYRKIRSVFSKFYIPFAGSSRTKCVERISRLHKPCPVAGSAIFLKILRNGRNRWNFAINKIAKLCIVR